MGSMKGRPATKIEVEAFGAIANLQDEVHELKKKVVELKKKEFELQLEKIVAEHREKWSRAGKWKDPESFDDCLGFLGTEGAELAKEVLEYSVTGRLYTRNNPDSSHGIEAIEDEVAGVLLMACVWCEKQGITLEDILRRYLRKMDKKRGL